MSVEVVGRSTQGLSGGDDREGSERSGGEADDAEAEAKGMNSNERVRYGLNHFVRLLSQLCRSFMVILRSMPA